MKKIFNYSLLSLLIFAGTSCDKGLEELNINKVNPTSLDPTLLLNNAIINAAPSTRTVIYDIGIVQQMVTPNGGVLAGANFNVDSRDATLAGVWSGYYQNVIRNTSLVIDATKENSARSNMYNMARIFQSYIFMVLTDEYGSIPYAEAGLGYTEQLFFPKYESQETVYNGIITELKEASAALNASGTIEGSDILYAGNIDKWKKFANSLLLRAGMRLSKVDPTRAQSIVQDAFAAGVIFHNEDNAYIRHDANFTQPIGNMLNSTEGANLYLAKPFVDHLKNTNDPRLSAIAIRYKGATSGNEQTVDRGTTAPADQIGMPMGYDNGTITARATADGLASFYDYSQVDRRRMAKTTAPTFLVTAAQTHLLLAEARFRGWITAGSAEEYYKDGIRAHMAQMAIYDAASQISGAAIETYINNNPLTAGKELEQINTQYWIASFLNGPEAFANFRRSGYPALAANPYPSADVPAGTFIRRITYPTTEISANTENVNAAISVQGPDRLDTRVWWDK